MEFEHAYTVNLLMAMIAIKHQMWENGKLKELVEAAIIGEYVFPKFSKKDQEKLSAELEKTLTTFLEESNKP